MATFGERGRLFLQEHLTSALVPALILLFVFVYFSRQIIFNIMPGEAAVLWRRFGGGTQIDYVFPEGIHFILPWDKLYIYNVRVQEIAHEFNVLTKNGLKVDLSISIRYYPQYEALGLLHQRVGPDYVNKLVIPEIESVLRIIIGKIGAHQVYTTETALIQKAVNEGIEQVAQRFVTIDDVVIKRVKLPPRVEEAIRYKLEQKHLADAYGFKLQREEKEAIRKKIEAGGIKTYNDIVNTSLSEKVLRWKGILATLELARSGNSKVVVIGSGKDQFQLFGNIPLEPLPHAKVIPVDQADTRETEGAPAASEVSEDVELQPAAEIVATPAVIEAEDTAPAAEIQEQTEVQRPSDVQATPSPTPTTGEEAVQSGVESSE